MKFLSIVIFFIVFASFAISDDKKSLSASGWSDPTNYHINESKKRLYLGFQCGNANNNGSDNVFLGYQSGWKSTGGIANVFVGYQTGLNNTIGVANTFLGYGSGANNTKGDFGIFIGQGSGYRNTEGDHNIFIGYQTGTKNIVGKNNTFVGSRSGENTTGSNNVFLGYSAGNKETGSQKLYIANSDTSQPLIFGNFSQSKLTINGTFSTMSDQRYKKNIATLPNALLKIMKLRGVTYEWKSDKSRKRKFLPGKQIGMIAQEIEKVIPEVVVVDDNGYKSVSYGNLVAVSIEAIKAQQKQIESLKAKLSEVEALKQEMAQFKKWMMQR